MNATKIFSLLLSLVTPVVLAYPIVGSEDTGIRRLDQLRLIQSGVISGRQKVAGAQLSVEQVGLRLLDHKQMELPASDPDFTAAIVKLLGENVDRYSVSVLDLTEPEMPRYAEHRGDVRRNPGSVGKIVAGAGLFQALADVYPDDLVARTAVLRETVITADAFILHDHHKVRIWHPHTRVLARRAIEVGDRGSLWEFLDWMLSASSNAAASTIMEHTMLLRHYAKSYPVSQEEKARFFAETSRQERAELFVRSLQLPLERNGIDLERLRQGSFFTRTGKRTVPGTSSYATTRELMNYLIKLEQGRIVDEFSSREIKRLLYMTERRIRYASSPALRAAAVYFKSGSLYSCQPEPSFKCKKYHGNKRNLMNSVAIVESPANGSRLYYMVTLTSNVLRKNSAVDHQTLATRIHRLIEKHHAGTDKNEG